MLQIPNNKPNSNAKRADLDLAKMIGLLNEDGIMGSKAGYDIDALQPKDRVLADEGKQRQQMEALKETDPDAYNKKTGGGNPHPPVKCAIRCAETGILVEKTPFITGAKSADGSRAEGSLFKLIGRTDTARGVSFDIPTNIRVDTRDGRKTVDITEAWITLCFKNDHPIRHKFKVEPLTDDEYAKLDEISEKGKALFRKLKDESDEIFQNNRSRSTGGIDVYSVTESDTASDGSILCDGKHYSKGDTLKASYDNLSGYRGDRTPGYHKGWKSSSKQSSSNRQGRTHLGVRRPSKMCTVSTCSCRGLCPCLSPCMARAACVAQSSSDTPGSCFEPGLAAAR